MIGRKGGCRVWADKKGILWLSGICGLGRRSSCSSPIVRIAFQAILEWTIDFWGTIHLNAIVSRSASESQNTYKSEPQVPVNNGTGVENAWPVRLTREHSYARDRRDCPHEV